MTEEEEVMAVKLALCGIGIWSKREYAERQGEEPREEGFAIVTLESAQAVGDWFFTKDEDKGYAFYPTRRAAMERAFELLAQRANKSCVA